MSSIPELVQEWRDRVKDFDSRLAKAAALHNLSEYAILQGKRGATHTCLQELEAALVFDQESELRATRKTRV